MIHVVICIAMGGGYSTHVANAYHRTIYVKADAKRSYVTLSEFAIGGSREGKSLTNTLAR